MVIEIFFYNLGKAFDIKFSFTKFASIYVTSEVTNSRYVLTGL